MRRRPEHIFEEWLILRCQGGDAKAFRQLFNRWEDRLRRYTTKKVRDPEAALDIVQETWMAIARGLSSLDDPAAFRSWAYRIATRKCADWIRSRQRARRDLTNHERVSKEGFDTTPDAIIGDAERVNRMRDEIRQLAADDQALLHLRYLEEMTVPAIADALEIPQGTVKSRLHALRNELRARLSETAPATERSA